METRATFEEKSWKSILVSKGNIMYCYDPERPNEIHIKDLIGRRDWSQMFAHNSETNCHCRFFMTFPWTRGRGSSGESGPKITTMIKPSPAVRHHQWMLFRSAKVGLGFFWFIHSPHWCEWAWRRIAFDTSEKEKCRPWNVRRTSPQTYLLRWSITLAVNFFFVSTESFQSEMEAVADCY